MDGSSVWTLATIGGPVILALVIAYAMIRRRRLTATEKEAQRQGTERNYREDGQ